MPDAPKPQASLVDVARLFTRLGFTSFGGPAAHTALMEDEVVTRRGWLSREQFLDLVGATNLIPGPNSTELAIHIGWLVAGRAGFLVAGACFILPATLIVMGFAWAYVEYGSLPQVEGLLYGVKPVVIVIVLQALVRLGRTLWYTPRGRSSAGVQALACSPNLTAKAGTPTDRSSPRAWPLAMLGLVAAGLSLWGVHELVVLFGAGIALAIGRAIARRRLRGQIVPCVLPVASLATAAVGASPAGSAAVSLWSLFLFFLKVGSVLFGSGYVLLAFLRADLVERWGWLTEQELLDAVAVGQVTPGPVFTTATFIGYLLSGPKGAAVATVGIFLPAFVFVALSRPMLAWLRRSEPAGAFLDGVNVASLALMAVVSWQLGRAALVDMTTLFVAGVAAILLFRYRVNSTWLILGGAIVGWIAAGW